MQVRTQMPFPRKPFTDTGGWGARATGRRGEEGARSGFGDGGELYRRGQFA